MNPPPHSFTDSSSVFDRFSKEELFDIGQALILQSRSRRHVPQQHTNHTHLKPFSPIMNQQPRSPRMTVPQPPPPIQHHTNRTNHQLASTKIRPLMEPHLNSPIPTSTSRRPASDSFENDAQARKRVRNNYTSRPTIDEQPEQPATQLVNCQAHKWQLC